jgi:hypothetical protein
MMMMMFRIKSADYWYHSNGGKGMKCKTAIQLANSTVWVGVLEDLPDVVKSKRSIIRAMMPLIGIARSYIVQTYRRRKRAIPSSWRP